LIKKGIVALYDTRKLSDAKYVGQRLFETSLMLDEVMSPGGIQIVEDARMTLDDAATKALDALIPGGWCQKGKKIEIDKEHSSLQDLNSAAFGAKLYEKTREIYRQSKPKKYLWGIGYISSRKVRALHASMRFLLKNPQMFCDALGLECATQPEAPDSNHDERPEQFFEELKRRTQTKDFSWDLEQFGEPINQEDQALTLLTFSYLLPRSIEHWGARLSIEQKNAFLHLWKVVGYTMGVRTDLTTDKWDEAEELYRRIMARQGDGSEAGQVLTKAVVQFTAQYLPSILGNRNVFTSGFRKAPASEEGEVPLACFPQKMVIDQMRIDRPIFAGRPGEKDPAAMILGKEEVNDCSRLIPRLVYLIFRIGMKIYFLGTDWILKPFPVLQRYISGLVRDTGSELYESFKGEYVRRPFYIPSDATEWTLEPGVTPEFRASLRKWRRGLFFRMVLGLGSAFAFTLFAIFFVVALAIKSLMIFRDSLSGNLYKELSDVWTALAVERHTIGWGQHSYSVMHILVITGVICALTLGLATIVLRYITPRFFKKRPHLQSELLEV
jgi:hypothetical protein